MTNTDLQHYAQQWKSFRYLDDPDRCEVCGLNYCHDSARDRRDHNKRHKQVLDVYEPKPHPELAQRFAADGPFLRIEHSSPLWQRRRLAGMAKMFQRELGFDFAPYHEAETNAPEEHHWLILAADGRTVGGLSVDWRAWRNAPTEWIWAWVWIIPSERRHGHAGRCWAMLKERFPAIEPERPLSLSMMLFFAGRTDVSTRTHRHVEMALRRDADRGAPR
jgi:hypothetical protein